ncbi:MAG: AAA family ATPase [Pseudomonas sp.]|nr:AAA family ATPase [Pseudomonas sp.]
MYKIDNVAIDGFWGESRIFVNFNKDVNILIGRNGTGKTTFMDILSSILTVDSEGLLESLFKKVTIKLSSGKRARTISVTKTDMGGAALVKYSISNRSYEFNIFNSEEYRKYFSARKKYSDKISEVKSILSTIVSLSSLSVYRYRKSDIEGLDREIARKYSSPVDMRLYELLQGLNKYQLELSQRSREVSIRLQKDVLTSLLYSQNEGGIRKKLLLEYSAETEKEKLLLAYEQLGISGSTISKKLLSM